MTTNCKREADGCNSPIVFLRLATSVTSALRAFGKARARVDERSARAAAAIVVGARPDPL